MVVVAAAKTRKAIKLTNELEFEGGNLPPSFLFFFFILIY